MQVNGAAERAVRTAKENLAQDKPFLALLTYRVTPVSQFRASLAELAYRWRLRTNPAFTSKNTQSNLKPPAVQQDIVRKLNAKFRARQKAGYDRPHGARSLSDLQTGTPVLAKLGGQKGWSQPAVVKQLVAPCSYLVQTIGGGKLWRDRRHL